MDSPVLGSIARLYEEFDKCADKETGVAKAEEIKCFFENNLDKWLENPSDPEFAKEVKEKVDAFKEGGIDRQKFAGLICCLVNAFGEGKVAVKESEPATSE